MQPIKISLIVERRKLERNEESLNRRREFQERFGSNSASRYRPTTRSNPDPEHGEMTTLLPPRDETLGYIT